MRRHWGFLFSALIIAALVFAYSAQHFWHIQPCHLCVYQRYLFAIALGVFGIPKLRFLTLYVLLLGLLLSLYQIGLEQHFWKDIFEACQVSSMKAATIEDLRKQLSGAAVVRCDQVNWRIFGVSAVIWTALVQGFLIGLWFFMKRIEHEKTS